jgi:type II secretory pathway component PulF
MFLVLSFGSVIFLYFLAGTLGSLARRKPAIDALLLRVPVVGPCVEALALGRFCMALNLTLETGMSIARALELSLSATANAAYSAQTETVTHAVKDGATLLEALERSHLFSLEFLSMVAAGEEGGRVPEIMRHQADYWNEEAGRRLKIAARLATMLIYAVYVGFMVWAIFSAYGAIWG